jgi:hypothetical protein
MGCALDLHFSSTDKKGERTQDVSDMDSIRKDFFCKYMGSPYFPKEINAKFGWATNLIGLEPAKYRDGSSGATTWIHIDVRDFESKYKDNKFFIKDEKKLAEQTLMSLANYLNLSFMCRCDGDIVAKLQDNYNDENSLFTVEDGKKALKVIYDKYGAEMATKIEKMYRCETTNFTSGQYKHCGTPGMEAVKGTSAPYYGWGSMKKFQEQFPEYITVGTWSAMEGKGLSDEGGIAQNTTTPKTFVKINSVLGAMEFVVYTLNKRGGQPGSWYSFDKDFQTKYDNEISKYVAYFVEEFKK